MNIRASVGRASLISQSIPVLPSSHHHAMVEVEHDPKGAADHKSDQYGGERQGSEVLQRCGTESDVEKEPEMHQDLEDCGDSDNDQRGEARQSVRGDECEGDGGQYKGQT